MYLKFLTYILSSAVFFSAQLAGSEVRCSSLISYTLEREGQITEVFFGEIRALAADESAAKSKIESDSIKSKTKALQQCRKLHENVSGCLHTKLESAAATMQAASFSARKALEDSLVSDCKKQQANCKEVKHSEVKCELLAEKTAEPEAASSKKEEPKKAKK